MEVAAALLDTWDRQCRILNNVGSLIDVSNRHIKPSPDGRTAAHQLAHIHRVRQCWLDEVAPESSAPLPSVFVVDWQVPIDDLEAIRSALDASASAVRQTVETLLAQGNPPAGPYPSVVHFLQHMVWHEGWHIGLLFLALRLNGQEPPEEWEDTQVWGQWWNRVD